MVIIRNFQTMTKEVFNMLHGQINTGAETEEKSIYM